MTPYHPATVEDQLVTDYLRRLRAATAGLPRVEADEILSTIAEHIATSRAEISEPTEADIRLILTRLGDPTTIAMEARGQSAGPAVPVHPPMIVPRPPLMLPRPPVAGPSQPGALEWGGIVVLSIGSCLFPIVGTLVGLAMVTSSRWWTGGQKATAWVLSFAGLLLVPVLGLVLFGFSTGTVEYGPVPAPAAPSQRPEGTPS